MGFLMLKNGVLLILIVFASPSYGMVYTWVDSVSVAHYTNKEYEIPARYRAKAKALYPEAGDISTPPQNVQASPVMAVKLQSAPAQQLQSEEPSRIVRPTYQRELQKQSVVRRTPRKGSRGKPTAEDE
jgi:hypothetical protein